MIVFIKYICYLHGIFLRFSIYGNHGIYFINVIHGIRGNICTNGIDGSQGVIEVIRKFISRFDLFISHS